MYTSITFILHRRFGTYLNGLTSFYFLEGREGGRGTKTEVCSDMCAMKRGGTKFDLNYSGPQLDASPRERQWEKDCEKALWR